jgi:hypothetical protein
MVAWSPRISSIHGLPNETHDDCCEGHDEWYVFEREAPVSDMEVFVNWGGFRLYDPQFKCWVDRLWLQMAHLFPAKITNWLRFGPRGGHNFSSFAMFPPRMASFCASGTSACRIASIVSGQTRGMSVP